MNDRPSSSELRQTIIEEWVKPRAQLMLDNEARAQSVVYVVAQFYDDEAVFAVHGHLFACTKRDPVWPELLDFKKNPIGEWNEELYGDAPGAPPEGAYWAQEKLEHLATETELGTAFPRWLDSNREMVVAFASFCKEGATQGDYFEHAYTPFCVVRRGEDEAEIVGALLRPDWEDCWALIDLHETYDHSGVDEALRALGGVRRFG